MLPKTTKTDDIELGSNPGYVGTKEQSIQSSDFTSEQSSKKWTWNSCLSWCAGTARDIPATWAQKYMGGIGAAFCTGTSLVLNYAIFASMGSNVFLLTNNNATLSNTGHSSILLFRNSYLKTCVNQLKNDVIFLKAYAGKREKNGQLQPGEKEQMNALLEDVAAIIVVASEENAWNYGKIALDVILVVMYVIRVGLYFAEQANKSEEHKDNCHSNSENAVLVGMDIAMTILSSSLYLWGFKRGSETDVFISNVSMRVGSLKNELAKAKAGVVNRLMTTGVQPSITPDVQVDPAPVAVTQMDLMNAGTNLDLLVVKAGADLVGCRTRINSTSVKNQ